MYKFQTNIKFFKKSKRRQEKRERNRKVRQVEITDKMTDLNPNMSGIAWHRLNALEKERFRLDKITQLTVWHLQETCLKQ